MVVICKGKQKLRVAESAFKMFYKNAGWTIEEKSSVKEPAKEVVDGSDDEWAEAMEEDAIKPLSEMNRSELEEMAKELGVSLAGLSTNKQIREAIKTAM